jgi:3-oxoacyl-(acyl-carrier-protein) synthase
MKREVRLALLGTGAVSPLGWGTRALLDGGTAARQTMATLSRPEIPHAVLRVPMEGPEAAALQGHPRLRRASGISVFLAGACRQALDDAETARGPIPRDRLGLIGLFHTGAVHYSRRFFQGAREQGKKFASPALFPETVYNSPLSHTAAILGLAGRVYSLVGDASGWAGALATAALWLELGAVEAVLVAASEELEPIALEAYEAAGWLGRKAGFLASEGAAALVVGKAGGAPVLAGLEEGVGFRAESGAAAVLEGWDDSLPVARIEPGAWPAGVEDGILPGRPRIGLPGPTAGEAFAATGGWNLIKAGSLGKPLVLPLWGSNLQMAALRLEA